MNNFKTEAVCKYFTLKRQYKEAQHQCLTFKLRFCAWLCTFARHTFGSICFILYQAHLTVPAALGFLELV